MVTLEEPERESVVLLSTERRAHRRTDLEERGIPVQRWDGHRRVARPFGQIVDISAGGVRIRTTEKNVRPDNQIRIRLELPEYAGISPFIDNSGLSLSPKCEWVGWIAVCRVVKVDDQHVEVAGRLVDMEDVNRGMLGLYLSTQPLAA